MKKIYKKLVRDRIPEMIERTGCQPAIRILTADEYSIELKKKLREECDEYLAADTAEKQLEEMADIFEVITALNESEGRTTEQVVIRQRQKRLKRGVFKERIFLESVDQTE